MNQYYIFPDKAKQVAAKLHQSLKNGVYNSITQGQEFAQKLTEDIHQVVPDKQMRVMFIDKSNLPDNQTAKDPQQDERQQAEETSFGSTKAASNFS